MSSAWSVPLPVFCCAGSLLLRGFFLVAVCRLLTAVSSLVVEHGLLDSWASAVAALGFSRCTGLVAEQHCLLPSVRTYHLDDEGG